MKAMLNNLSKLILLITLIFLGACSKSDPPANDLEKIPTYTVSTFAGDILGDLNGTTTTARFYAPNQVALDPLGNVYVSDTANHKIKKISTTGVVTTFAGSKVGFADGTGTEAKFYSPLGLVVDALGNVYVADSENNSIRKITPAGVVTTLAGSGTAGFANGNGSEAQFNTPTGVTIDVSGNVYVTDTNNHKIRKITPTGDVSTFAGSTPGSNDGNDVLAKFDRPTAIAIDSFGYLYVTDTRNHNIRIISAKGVVITFAGTNEGITAQGFADGPTNTAKFSFPNGIAVDATRNVYVTDTGNNRIRKINKNNIVSTIAGSEGGYMDGTGTTAKFSEPYGVTVDLSGNIFVADTGNVKIRKITQD